MYFGAMFFEVQVQIFVELINFQMWDVFQYAFANAPRNC